MNNTTTIDLSVTALTPSKKEKTSKKKLNGLKSSNSANPLDFGPSEETIQNILNYSKALKVQHSSNTGLVSNVMN
jgi:hypothetical protein